MHFSRINGRKLARNAGASELRYTMRNNENAHMGFRCVIREKRQLGLGTMDEDVYGSGITGLIRSSLPSPKNGCLRRTSINHLCICGEGKNGDD